MAEDRPTPLRRRAQRRAVDAGQVDGDPTVQDVVLHYDASATPKVRLSGAPGSVDFVARLLALRFGPPRRLSEGLGWNLNRSDFALAQAMLTADTDTPTAGARRHRILLAESEAAVKRLRVAGRPMRFVGYGGVFVADPAQHAADPPRPAGSRVRYAYYL